MQWKKGNKLKLVSENEAPERTQQIYREIKHALGLPYVSVVFQAYAAYPEFLALHWQALQPIVASQEFFELSERLRADAYTRAFNYFEVPDLRKVSAASDSGPAAAASGNARPELSTVVDTFYYANPMLLLIVAAQFQSFEAPIGRHGKTATHPAEHPIYQQAPVLADEATTPPRIRQIFEELRRTLALPYVSFNYRAMALWPDFLAAYWDLLKKALQSPLYEGCQHSTRETAFALTREFPQPMDLSLVHLAEAGIPDEDIASIVRLTDLFVRSLSGLLMNISLAKIALEGGTKPQPQPAETPAASAVEIVSEAPKGDKERAA